MGKLGERRSGLEELENQLGQRAEQEQDAKAGARYLEEFCDRVSEGLESINFEDRQKLLRLVVERITVEDNMVRIETIIPLTKICNCVHVTLSLSKDAPFGAHVFEIVLK